MGLQLATNSRRLLERIKEAKRILVEARERDGCGSIGDDDREGLRGLSYDEIIQLERERLGRAKAERRSEGDIRALPGATG